MKGRELKKEKRREEVACWVGTLSAKMMGNKKIGDGSRMGIGQKRENRGFYYVYVARQVSFNLVE